jgi:membrane-bound metal-dependent hydrolase YbcI (DUF457 family)
MFIGHFGIGFGAKKLAPEASLGSLFLAAQFLDLLWPTLLLLDLEQVAISPGITKVTPLDFVDYPISHSLAIVTVWGLLAGLVSWFFRRNIRYSVVIALCVISHWFLDLVVHRPDLPVWPGDSIKLGLGLWNYPIITALVEGILLSAGVLLYCKATAAKNKFGRYGLVALVAFLIFIQVGNMAAPPPPNVTAIAWAGQLQWLLVVLAYFIDKNRVARHNSPAQQGLALS